MDVVTKTDVIVQPIDILSKKLDPITYEQVIQIHQEPSMNQNVTALHNIIQDNRTGHQDMDRNIIIARLKTNGFLLNPCIQDKTVATAINNDVVPKVVPVKPNVVYDDDSLPDDVSLESPKEDESVSDSDSTDENKKKQDKQFGKKLPKKLKITDVDDTVDDGETSSPTVDNKQETLPTVDDYDRVSKLDLKLDPNTVFVVCNSKSVQKPPGKEASEKIEKSRHSKKEFQSLADVTNWRILLCNSSTDHPFTLDEVEWKSVEHFFIASQFKKQPLYSTLSRNYELALEVDKKKKYEKKKVVVDDDFQQHYRKVMYDGLYAKFIQHPELARVLDATKNAVLYQRINAKKTEEFIELMWLRESLRNYTRTVLKPLNEENVDKPTDPTDPTDPKEPAQKAAKKTTKQKDASQNLKDVSIEEYQMQLPPYKPDVIKGSSYYLNNRVQFIKSINKLFNHILSREQKEGDSTNFELLDHQRIVLNYLHGDRPYHGLLVYHNLGTGKSCTSIAVAEGMKHDKEIVVLLPASLKPNYIAELQKCGDILYRQNQYWEFVSTEGRPELIPVLAKALQMTTAEVTRKKGAYMVDIRKEPNFDNLSPDDQIAVQEQIQHMIKQKYKTIHYNANNLGQNVAELGKHKKNPFDHTVVILEEAHNFISRIVGNLRKKKTAQTSVYIKLYEQMLQATDFRIVMLSGTPILNYPQEMGVMFNLLRGGIQTWTFDIDSASTKLSTESIDAIFKKERLLTYDYLQYQYGKLVVTKNPYGFINVNSIRTNTNQNNNTQKRLPKPAKVNTSRKNAANTTAAADMDEVEPLSGGDSTMEMKGGAGKYGVRLDKQGNIDGKQFSKTIETILAKNKINIKKVSSKYEKCLPDTDNFLETFVKPSYDNKGNDDPSHSDLLQINTLRRRILGLTSYFRTANTDVLPRIIMNDEGHPIHEVKVPMSDHQIDIYMKIRNQERDREKKQARNKRANENKELFDSSTSSYRVFSRCACNFTFPNELKRPVPKGPGSDNNDNANHLQEHSIEDATPVEMAEYQDEEAGPKDDFYQQEIAHVMKKLRENRETFLSEEKLKQYSPKMWAIIQNLKNPQYKGLHLLYSAFRTLEGIGIFKEVLISQGFQEFKLSKVNGTWDFDSSFQLDGRPCFVLYTGTEDVEMREIMRNIYNGDWNPPNVPENISIRLREVASNNLYGEIIQLFMITAAGAEGINLKNTRYVHMMEPYWNFVRLEQVMGRARRIKSHIDLPKEEQTVQTFLYLSVLSDSQKKGGQYKDITENDLSKVHENTPITTDEYLYEVSLIKQKINKQLLTVMKETAMDCHVHIQSHKKQEKLVCYGPKTGDANFVDYPSLDKVLEEGNM